MVRFIASSLLALAGRLKRGGVIINGHTLTRHQTRVHLDVLGRSFDFVGLDELPQRLARPAGRPFCLLTFDDGKHSNYTEIAPELEARGVPAVFYVTTGAISSGVCLWFDRREQLVRKLGHCPGELELASMKQLPFDRMMERLDRACSKHGFQPECVSDDARLMSWDEVRHLAQRGFTIGAHGRTHAILTNETRERAFEEIELSLAEVNSELGLPCRTFAFPNGNYTPELAQHVVRRGAGTVMTTEPMWAHRGTALWRLPRIQIHGGFTPARTELKIALAALPGVLANPDGTGKAYRLASPWREDHAGEKVVGTRTAHEINTFSRFSK